MAEGGGRRKQRSTGGRARARRGPRSDGDRAQDRSNRPQKRHRRNRGDNVRDEILKLGGRDGLKYYDLLMKAADAYARDHEREALRTLRPLRDAMPDSPSVRELLGLSLYRAGHFTAAAKELEEYTRISGAVDQLPVLMDCYRAQRRWRKVDSLWNDLRGASASAEVVTEGRIVAAGALADRGRVPDALKLLGRRTDRVANPKPYHLRLWYALADLEERSGNLPGARSLFDKILGHDPRFADVAERLSALGRSR